MQQGSLPIGAGVLLGIGGAIALTRVLKSLLYEVSALDPAIFVTVSLGLVIMALAAVLIPAGRAIKIDPLKALRSE